MDASYVLYVESMADIYQRAFKGTSGMGIHLST